MEYNRDTIYERPDDPELFESLNNVNRDVLDLKEVDHGFPAEAREEDSELLGTLDSIQDPYVDRDVAIADSEGPLLDAELLDELPLQGFPEEEAERRKVWSRAHEKAGLHRSDL